MSTLSQTADDYLRLRRAFGHKLDNAGRQLPRLVAYLEARGAETITLEAALAWAQQPAFQSNCTMGARRMTVARGFARHLAGIDPQTEVPPVGMLPYHKHRRVPYLYSSADVASLMIQARRTIPSPLRAATFETLIGMLAVTGMRIGEAIRLDRSDVDWDQGLALVRASKFGKSRALPLQASTQEALADYAQRRDRLQPSPKTTSFFISITGKRLNYGDVQFMFQNLVSGAGVGATWLTGIATVRTSNHVWPGWPPTSVIVIRASRTGISPLPPSYSLWLPAALRFLRKPNYELARPYAAILLHRPLGPSAPGESAHRGRLP